MFCMTLNSYYLSVRVLCIVKLSSDRTLPLQNPSDEDLTELSFGTDNRWHTKNTVVATDTPVVNQ